MSSSGQKSSRAAERSIFVNMLSRYLKEKRNIGDLAGGNMAAKLEAKGLPVTTMNLLPNVENSTENSRQKATASASNVKPSDFFSNVSAAGNSGSMEDAANRTDFRKPETTEMLKTAPLTIFFAGQVLVYNDFPAEKAKEIVALASQVCSSISTGFVSDIETSGQKLNAKNTETNIPDLNIASTSGSSPVAEQPSVDRSQSIGSDLQIAKINSFLGQAKKNSLQKFFEKRKDRATATAPYNVQNRRGSPSPKPDEGQSSKEGLKDLDLKL
ncbi:hypothetical protein SLA2020_291160 [Shorea laevis]